MLIECNWSSWGVEIAPWCAWTRRAGGRLSFGTFQALGLALATSSTRRQQRPRALLRARMRRMPQRRPAGRAPDGHPAPAAPPPCHARHRCREFRDAARVMGNTALFQQMEKASSAIKRDVIFAASLCELCICCSAAAARLLLRRRRRPGSSRSCGARCRSAGCQLMPPPVPALPRRCGVTRRQGLLP